MLNHVIVLENPDNKSIRAYTVSSDREEMQKAAKGLIHKAPELETIIPYWGTEINEKNPLTPEGTKDKYGASSVSVEDCLFLGDTPNETLCFSPLRRLRRYIYENIKPGTLDLYEELTHYIDALSMGVIVPLWFLNEHDYLEKKKQTLLSRHLENHPEDTQVSFGAIASVKKREIQGEAKATSQLLSLNGAHFMSRFGLRSLTDTEMYGTRQGAKNPKTRKYHSIGKR